MKIRQIGAADLAAVERLLCEGFPRQTPAYWRRALQIMQDREAPADLPRYGLVIDNDGRLDGVLLTVASVRDGKTLCNLSSWYVREGQRQHSIFLLRGAMRNRSVTYTDISPAQAIVPMIGKLGFRPYTAGALLLTPARMLQTGQDSVRALDETALAGLEAGERGRILRHIGCGCAGLMVGDMPALYRVKRLKGIIPSARFVCGAPARLVASAGPLLRFLARRGIVLAMLDVPQGGRPAVGRYFPRRDLRYAAGGDPPEAGDLLDTELSLFGP